MRPRCLSVKDYVALLIGKAVMHWGEVDQILYNDITRLAIHSGSKKYPHEVEIEDTFEARIKSWRKALLAADAKAGSLADKAIRAVNREILMRHILVHGYVVVIPIGPRGERGGQWLHVTNHRETANRIKEITKRAARTPGIRVMASDLHPIYSVAEMENHIAAAEGAVKLLRAAGEAVLPRPVPAILSAPRKRRTLRS
jgi:hypothetical protein